MIVGKHYINLRTGELQFEFVCKEKKQLSYMLGLKRFMCVILMGIVHICVWTLQWCFCCVYQKTFIGIKGISSQRPWNEVVYQGIVGMWQ